MFFVKLFLLEHLLFEFFIHFKGGFAEKMLFLSKVIVGGFAFDRRFFFVVIYFFRRLFFGVFQHRAG